MKLKSLPSDFQVSELTGVRPTGGPHALYLLRKRSLGTPEAVQAILRNWNLPRQRLSYGGLKDRHAETTQYLTIEAGPRSDLQDRSFTLEYLGQTGHRFTAQNIAGNRFCITLRNLADRQRPAIDGRLQLVSQLGLVNYFDDQRFGSLGESGQFIAEPWCRGDYQRALYLALAEPNHHDRPREKEQKSILREHWGDWTACKQLLDRSHRRSIVTFLMDHPTNFKRAVALLRSDLRGIYVAAFQSGLWNRWLSRLIASRCQPSVAWLPSPVGDLAIPELSGESAVSLDWLVSLELPLPAARQHQWPSPGVEELDAILTEYGLERRELRLKYPRDTFFSKGMRPCWLKLRQFSHQWQPDQLHPGRQALQLQFELPRGAYATLVVKLLQAN